MIVRQENFREILRKLNTPSIYALDTETTGLFPYKGDRLFSLIIANESESYYFNFQDYPDLNPSWVLPRSWLQEFVSIFLHPNNLWFIHNSKFDLGILLQEGLEIGGDIHDTEIVARQLESCHLTYGLGDCAKRIGLAKSSAVDDYIDANKLYTWVTPPGKKTRKKNKHFNLVPFHIISAYGEQDGRVTHQLGTWQRARLAQLSIETPSAYRPPGEIYDRDRELVKVCFDMERVGIKVNIEYSRAAIAYYEQVIADKAKEFFDISGLVLDDTKSVLVEAFTRAGEIFPKTAKGNPSFTDDVLAGFKTPLASVVRAYREASKITAAYFRSFIFFADHLERIHANFRIAGTETSRFSISDPPLQQLPKEETGPFPVRRAIVPFDSESALVMIDYSQMEYRMMVDYARDHKLAAMIRAGLDVHEATSKMVGISRNYAKTLNFMLLYGGGIDKLAAMLKITRPEAVKLKDKYFSSLPTVRAFSRKVIRTATEAGRIYNWAGYVTHYKDPNFSYTAPNHLIQGGCAQVVRRAMVDVWRLLQGRRSKLILQIHDELLFNMYPEDFHLIPKIKEIMENSYVSDSLVPLTCEVSHSFVSWGDKQSGYPEYEASSARNRS